MFKNTDTNLVQYIYDNVTPTANTLIEVNRLPQANKNYEVKYYGKTGIKMPTGTDAERPASPEPGTLRFSTTSNKLEIYTGSGWQTVTST